MDRSPLPIRSADEARVAKSHPLGTHQRHPDGRHPVLGGGAAMREWLFPLFGIFTIAAATGVVFSRNAIYSAFSLVLAFFGLAGIFVLWGNNFLAMLQILIYAGAIVVLF